MTRGRGANRRPDAGSHQRGETLAEASDSGNLEYARQADSETICASGIQDVAAFAGKTPQNIYVDVHAQVTRISGAVLGKRPPQELVHDICVEVALSAFRYRGDCAFSSWVYAVVARRIHRWIRKESGYRHLLTKAERGHLAQHPCNPEEALLTEELVERLLAAITTLPERERSCLVMVRFDLVSVQEAAEKLRISPDAVRMNIYRARNRLRKALDPNQDGT